MNIVELIAQLEDLKDQYGDEVDVRIAEQPAWPFENEINQVEAVNLSEEKCEVCGGSGMMEDEEGDEDERPVKVICDNCDGTGVYREDDAEKDGWVVYLAQGNQIGYLPGAAAEALGWGHDR